MNLSPPGVPASQQGRLTTGLGGPSSHSMETMDYINEGGIAMGNIEALVSVIVPIIFGLIVIVGLFGK
jgi:hypothetical protein